MTPEQKLKHLILLKGAENADIDLGEITADNIDDLWWDNDGCDFSDARYEFREGEIETDIDPDWSRHYESRSVAARYLDGSWIGWTYWYGGGKHGEPEAIDWIEHAYDLDVTEEEKMVVVRTFKKL